MPLAYQSDAARLCDNDKINRRRYAFDDRADRVAHARRPAALRNRLGEGVLRGDHARLFQLGVLFQFRREIDGVADHSELEPLAVTDYAVHDLSVGDRDRHAEWRQSPARTLGSPVVARADESGHRAKRIGRFDAKPVAATETHQNAIA
jgi:hypothetical protein